MANKVTDLVLYMPRVVFCGYEDASLYKILHIPKTASEEDIRTSYRRLAVAYHPDKNPNNLLAAQYFKEVSRAYSIINDTVKRDIYDNYGTHGLKIGNTYGDQNVHLYFYMVSIWNGIKKACKPRYNVVVTRIANATSYFAGYLLRNPNNIEDV